MATLIALYKKPKDPAAFDKWYFEVHTPLAVKMPGLQRMEIAKITDGPGAAQFYMIAQLHFKDMDALKAGAFSPEGKAAGKDAAAFAGDILTIMFAENEVVPLMG